MRVPPPTGEPGAPAELSQTCREEQGRVAALLDRAYKMAGSQLDGVEQAAKELAVLCGDSSTASAARRVVLGRLEAGGDRVDRQVASLLRRAIELGAGLWAWDNTKPLP
ncbi:MAG TPA: hypothetical protein VL984_09235 [Acidimicrobiales bacterium]|nr:hypothetical protein [Acidimicrobiales bacterium]